MIVGPARIALAGVLLFGGLAKLADRDRSRASIVAFGVPVSVAGPFWWSLIGAEFLIATALLFGRSPVWGAVGALALLASVSAAVGANLVRGRRPDCHCFGRLSRGPIGWPTLARNGVLASLAGYVAVGGHAPALFGGLACLSGAAWLALGPLRPHGSSGAHPPDFSLPDAGGAHWTLQGLLAEGRPVLLVFSQSACGACRALLGDLRDWHARFGDRLTIAVVSQSSAPAPDQSAADQIGLPSLLDPGGATASAYGVTATPSAALIERSGRMASALARGGDEIGGLVRARFDQDDLPQFARRTVIMRAARGMTSLGGFSLLAAACGSSKSSSTATSSRQPKSATATRPRSLRAGGTYICQQSYALCTNAPCRRSDDPNTVICDCVVKSGYSVGLTSCSRRAPHGTAIYSTFSTALVTTRTRAMTCPADVEWANCVDAPCQLDASNPLKATCHCPVVKHGPSFTFGGDCATHTCGQTVWSGAHSTIGGSAVATAMRRLGQPLSLPAPCPKS